MVALQNWSMGDNTGVFCTHLKPLGEGGGGRGGEGGGEREREMSQHYEITFPRM